MTRYPGGVMTRKKGVKMLDCVMSITNTGIFERGQISPVKWYTIDKVILKMRSGKRLTRYAVCINGCWKTGQQMTLREAREQVRQARAEFEESKYYAMGI